MKNSIVKYGVNRFVDISRLTNKELKTMFPAVVAEIIQRIQEDESFGKYLGIEQENSAFLKAYIALHNAVDDFLEVAPEDRLIGMAQEEITKEIASNTKKEKV